MVGPSARIVNDRPGEGGLIAQNGKGRTPRGYCVGSLPAGGGLQGASGEGRPGGVRGSAIRERSTTEDMNPLTVASWNGRGAAWRPKRPVRFRRAPFSSIPIRMVKPVMVENAPMKHYGSPVSETWRRWPW